MGQWIVNNCLICLKSVYRKYQGLKFKGNWIDGRTKSFKRDSIDSLENLNNKLSAVTFY